MAGCLDALASGEPAAYEGHVAFWFEYMEKLYMVDPSTKQLPTPSLHVMDAYPPTDKTQLCRYGQKGCGEN